MNRIVDLGCITFQKVLPKEYERHVEGMRLGEVHDVVTVASGKCWADYKCRTCGIAWQTDTSG